jgi:outer membrane protein TolC
VCSSDLRHTQQLANLTALYAKTGQGVVADDDRARAELAVRENDVQRGIEEIQVASARLAEQLRLDPSLRFEPREPVAVPLEFQSQQSALPELIAFGLTHRPEVSENRSLAIEASDRLRREQYATLVPSVILAMSYGGLGGGFGSDFVNFGDRLDVDAIAWWEVRNLGFGERAARGEARSKLQQAQWKEIAVLDRVAREVVEAQSQIESRRRQLATAETGIRAAEASFERNLERIRHAQGLPLEVLQSIQALAQARREYLRVVISYNEAQFRLQRALGWPVESVGTTPSE